MEQSILTPEAHRQINTIVELTRLTYEGKLLWFRHSQEPEKWEVFPGAGVVTSLYNTEVDNQRFVLLVTLPDGTNPYAAGVWDFSGQEAEPKISLRVFSKTGRMLTNFSGLSLLQALADAVQSQVDSQDDPVSSVTENVGV